MNECIIENLLEQHPDLVEEGLKVVERQKRVSNGIIDLFCQDKENRYVVVELKVKPTHAVVAQIAKYLLSLEKQGIPKTKLRGILVTAFIDEKIQQLCDYFGIETKQLAINESSLKKPDFYDLEDNHYYLGHIEEDQREAHLNRSIEENNITPAEAKVLRAIFSLNNYFKYPTHEDISNKINITKTCIRGYLSSIITKGVPLLKRKNKEGSNILRLDYEKLSKFTT